MFQSHGSCFSLTFNSVRWPLLSCQLMKYRASVTRPENETVTPTEHFAKAVKVFRRRKDWSQPELAQRCAAAGLDWNRSIVANVEAGRRDSVSIQELLTLAFVLGVPPALLLFPVGSPVAVEVMPGKAAPPWDALRWFAGEGPYPLSPEEYNRLYGRGEQDPETGFYERYEGPFIELAPGVVVQEWEPAAAPILLLRRHDDLIREWIEAPREMARRELDGSAEERDPGGTYRLAARRNRIEDTLAGTRAEMRRHGLVPPQLPQQLEHLERIRGARRSDGEEGQED